MEDTEQRKRKKSTNWAKWAALFAGVMVVINLILLTDIRINIPWFRKAAYFGKLLEKPTSFQIKSRNVSPLYFTELVYKGSDSIRYKGKLKFSIKVKEKGKNFIQEPEFRVYVVDAIGDLRGLYPYSESMMDSENLTAPYDIKDDIKKANLTKSINFSFNMPSVDQKVIGVWKIFVYLYDAYNNELVSYLVHDFEVTDKPLISWSELLGVVLTVFMVFVVVIIKWLRDTKYRLKRKK